jgi:hypothetical protein
MKLSSSFKPIPGYGERYFISNRGEVYSKTNGGRLLKGGVDHAGYKQVTLFYQGKYKFRKVHQLVLEVFYKPRPFGLVAAHLDGQKTNNCINNLDWVSYKENEAHKLIHGTRAKGERHGKALLTKKDVLFIRENYKFRCKVFGALPLARMYGVNPVTITLVTKRRTWRDV